MSAEPLLRSEVADFPCRRGKVRDVYDLGDRLVIVATDRLSAFDWVLPTPIPGKGRLLTQLTLFWFRTLGVHNHLLGTDLAAMGPACDVALTLSRCAPGSAGIVRAPSSTRLPGQLLRASR